MTNAIEQSKREMYAKFSDLYTHVLPSLKSYELCKIFESALESYLELLRQDHEALHETARKRFEDIQGLEAVNSELQRLNDKQYEVIRSAENTAEEMMARLAAMTHERDLLRNRQQASEAAHATYSEKGATVHQSSGGNASCVTLDGKMAAILGALLDAQSVMVEYLVPDGIRAKDAIGKMIPILDNEKLYVAMRGFEHPSGGYAAWFLNNDKCMHSFPSGEQCVFCGVGK